jgi:hypothetical protein
MSGNTGGNTINQNRVYLFDGLKLKRLTPDRDRLSVEHGVSKGYYGVVFIIRDYYYPDVIVFKSNGIPFEVKPIALTPVKDKEMGVLTGVVYTPIVGGKLREHRGIKRLFSEEEVRIFNKKHSYKVKTDIRGVFTILLPEGEYSIVSGGSQGGKIRIKSGKTTIKNIQKGLVLID